MVSQTYKSWSVVTASTTAFTVCFMVCRRHPEPTHFT
jgi:hypothetical protein